MASSHDDARPLILYRVYSPSSAGKLVSGAVAILGSTPRMLSESERREDYSLHRQAHSRIPTRLVSATNSFPRALTQAFRLYQAHCNDPHHIILAFISVSLEDGKEKARRAQSLVEPDDDRSDLLASEFLFDWHIDEQSITHQVSVATLVDRGLLERLPWLQADSLTAEKTRVEAKRSFGLDLSGHDNCDSNDRYLRAFDAGVGSCSIGLIFGFRAPFVQIFSSLLQGLWRVSFWPVAQQGIDLIIESTFASSDFLHTLAQRDEAEDFLEEARHEILTSAYEQLQGHGNHDEANKDYDTRIEEAEQSCEATIVRLGF